jgi:hypothetical protein
MIFQKYSEIKKLFIVILARTDSVDDGNGISYDTLEKGGPYE